MKRVLFVWRWYRDHLWMLVATAPPFCMSIGSLIATQWELAVPWILSLWMVFLNAYAIYKWEFWREAAYRQLDEDAQRMRRLVDQMGDVVAAKLRDDQRKP